METRKIILMKLGLNIILGVSIHYAYFLAANLEILFGTTKLNWNSTNIATDISWGKLHNTGKKNQSFEDELE